MDIYHRPEMELDPAKFPGQIVNRPDYPQAVNRADLDRRPPGLYLRDVVARIQKSEEADNAATI